MARLRPPAANASQAEKDAYRERVRQMIAGSEDADLAAVPDVKRENDPYIAAQLAALRRMIDESYDADTGKYGKQGVIEFMFTVMNDKAVQMDARIKAANTLISYFHKKVPNTLMVAQQTNLADVDLSGLKPEELDTIQSLLDKALTTAPAPQQAASTTVAVEQHPTKH